MVKFVSYDGKYPNLCNGHLVLDVDGQVFEFPECCLSSGGNCHISSHGERKTTKGKWIVREWPDNFPQAAKTEAIRVINENIHHGCCGGCL